MADKCQHPKTQALAALDLGDQLHQCRLHHAKGPEGAIPVNPISHRKNIYPPLNR